jgi:hypothetical protein
VKILFVLAVAVALLTNAAVDHLPVLRKGGAG